MKINIVVNPANKSWIIEKIGLKLKESLTENYSKEVVISDVPLPGFDVTHHMSWAFASHLVDGFSTMFITHLDDKYKIEQVKTTLEQYVDIGICMSSDTMRMLIENGVPPESLTYILPAHDGEIEPRPIVIGITSRVYPDGRKREALLNQLSEQMNLAGFEFQIFGDGWDKTVSCLEKAGALVNYFPESSDYRADYVNIKRHIPGFDYYLYLGLDEGSLGTLDALSAGVKTIITPQGFHVDLPHGITHAVVDGSDLLNVFKELKAEREARVAFVRALTWNQYAENHYKLWTSGLGGQYKPVPNQFEPANQKIREAQRSNLKGNSASLRRWLSHISHQPPFREILHFIRK